MENEKNLIDNMPSNISDSGVESQPKAPEMVNHPSHYNNYDIEVIDMMEKIWGTAYLYIWCTLTAYKYRMRMGTKPGSSIEEDLRKEQWYLKKAAELKEKLNQQKK
jgi:hypothetical protein